jgi:hypothetical protein
VRSQAWPAVGLTTPEAPVEATRLGHRPVWDPPAGMSSAYRWTCDCGHAVLRVGYNVYGSATEDICERTAVDRKQYERRGHYWLGAVDAWSGMGLNRSYGSWSGAQQAAYDDGARDAGKIS